MDSTTKNKQRNSHPRLPHDGGLDDRIILLFGSLLSLVGAPKTFQVTRSIEQDTFKANIFASILTIILAVIFSILLKIISEKYGQFIISKLPFRKNNNNISGNSSHLNETSDTWQIFSGWNSYIYGQSLYGSPRYKSRNKQSLNKDGSQENSANQRRQSRLDPKYFKPKYVIHELMTFWDTTCTVITWGSFYVIGGTIVATEKLARKIKARQQRAANNIRESAHNTSSSANRQQQQNQTDPKEANQPPRNRISTWTKKCYSSAKKKIISVTTGTGGIGPIPQIEESRGGGGLLNTSFLSGSFRSS